MSDWALREEWAVVALIGRFSKNLIWKIRNILWLKTHAKTESERVLKEAEFHIFLVRGKSVL